MTPDESVIFRDGPPGMCPACGQPKETMGQCRSIFHTFVIQSVLSESVLVTASKTLEHHFRIDWGAGKGLGGAFDNLVSMIDKGEVPGLISEQSAANRQAVREVELQQSKIVVHESEQNVALKIAQIEKDKAYTERNKLVAAISKLFPASLERHLGEAFDPGWEWVVIADLPTGQVSWHIHNRELNLFDHLLRETGRTWDGHTTDEKYERLSNLKVGPV